MTVRTLYNNEYMNISCVYIPNTIFRRIFILNLKVIISQLVKVLLREEETKMALDDADIKAVELDAQKALLEQAC